MLNVSRYAQSALLVASCALAAAVQPAVAGTFSISPIRAELSAQKTTEALTVRNEASDRAILVQAQAMAWSQVDGQDTLVATRDVLVTPPVFTLAPSASQIVRVAVRRPADAQRELTYRLILQEVPPEAPKDFTGLQVALRLSLPIFVAARAKAAPDVHWRSTWLADGSLQVIAENRGSAHLQVIDFTVAPVVAAAAAPSIRNSVVKYVLPGATVSWTLQTPEEFNRKGPFTLRGATDYGELFVELAEQAIRGE